MTLNHCFKVCNFLLGAVLAIGASFTPSAFADYFIIDANDKILVKQFSPGYRSVFQDLNNAGQVVAASYSPYANAIESWLSGPNGEGEISWISRYRLNHAEAVNDAGQVVGSYNEVVNRGSDPLYMETGPPNAFITGPNGVGMKGWGTLGGDHGSRATDINGAGQDVGSSDTTNGESHAFITGPDGIGMRDLGTLGGSFRR